MGGDGRCRGYSSNIANHQEILSSYISVEAIRMPSPHIYLEATILAR
jgi:hypothetical protein